MVVRPHVLGFALLAACGGGGGNGDGGADDDDDDGGGGAADAMILPDSGPSCGTTWRRVQVPVTGLALMDPVPLNGARAVRVAATVDLGPCEERAMPQLSWSLESEDVFVDMYAWRPVGPDCSDTGTTVTRPVVLELYAGQWTVHGGAPPGQEILVVDVGAPPARPCDTSAAPCEMDCDCAGVGERCLGGNGFAGPFTQCALPCELDRDCFGNGQCINVADGLDFSCSGGAECSGSQPCPGGFACNGGACQPAVQLGSGTRIECDCDADCEAPLRCIESDYLGRVRRCEIACPTAGPWCNGPHFCGGAYQDVASLAPADSVCVFVGE